MILCERTLPDGRTAYVTPLTFGRARICVVNQYDPMLIDRNY